jgi:cysteine-rich repeat protein
MGRAIQRCVQQVIAEQQACMDAELAGETCDEARRDQQINAAKLAARRVVTTDCTGGQLTELHFIDQDDARTDISKTCTDQPAAVMSLAYAPAQASGAAGTPDESTRDCLMRAASYSRKLLRYIVREKTRALDMMAVQVIAPAKKNALVNRAQDRAARARDKLAQRLAAACPRFADMYGRDPVDVLSGLSLVGNCVVGAAYVQTSIACPAPVCGNGVKESGEQCDDGNTVDDDNCRNNCTTP